MKKPYIQPRQKVLTPKDLVTTLSYAIRDQLYRKEQKHLFHGQLKDLHRSITWPAAWFNERRIFVTPERYLEIFMHVLVEIRGHGNIDRIDYWPRYILTCVQRHFSVNAQRYNDEGKAARDLVERAVKLLPPATAAADADPSAERFMETMAAAHQVCRSPGGRKKQPAPTPKPVVPAPAQKELF